MRQRSRRRASPLPRLALALALLSGASAARADDEPGNGADRESRTLASTATEVFGKHFVLTLEDGRRVPVELPRRDVVLSPGERIEATGSDEEDEFEASRLVRADGSVVTDRGRTAGDRPGQEKAGREGSPAAAPIGAAAAIAASERAGYPVVTELEWEDGAWEIEALDPRGRPAKLRIDASTGEVVHGSK